MAADFLTTARKAGGMRLRAVNAVITVTLTVLILLLMQVVFQVNNTLTALEEADKLLVTNERTAYDLEKSSRILTEKARAYVITGDPENLYDFAEEFSHSENRATVASQEERMGKGSLAIEYYAVARAEVNRLVAIDGRAMALAAASRGNLPERGD